MASKAYEDLTDAGKRRRQVREARQALAAYGMPDASVACLDDGKDGPAFRVRTGKDHGRAKFFLRMHYRDRLTPDMIRSELCWLRAIRDDTGILVPEPVPNEEGEDVTALTGTFTPWTYHCTLMRWVPGRTRLRAEGPGEAALRRVGGAMARLHDQAQGFEPPAWFVRPAIDWEGLYGASSPFAPHDGLELDPIMSRLFTAVMSRIRDTMERLGKGRDLFGLIHGDLTQLHYLFDGDEVRFIDFGDCGFGHYVYDMAVTLLMLSRLDLAGTQRRAFLEGYREVRELSDEHARLIDQFMAARAVALARLLLGNRRFGTDRHAWVEGMVPVIKGWMAS